MHTVTKVLIVFCAVFVLLLAALTVSYSANADRIVSALKSERDAKLAAEASAAQDKAALGQERARLEKDIEALRGQISDRDRDINDLRSRAATAVADKLKAEFAVVEARSQLNQLASGTEMQAKLLERIREEVVALRDEQLKATQREIELVDRLNDLESQNEVLEQTARALREQLTEAQLALQVAMSGGTQQVAGRSGVFESTGPLIRGSVREVIKSPTGEDLVVMDVGTQVGVKENMRLNITRGNQFLGVVVVTKADPRQAVGRVNTFDRKDVKIEPNDVVLSRLQ